MTSIPKEDFDSLNAKHKELLECEVQLKIEQSKLKEIADISQIQISDFEQRKDNSFIELEALKHQVWLYKCIFFYSNLFAWIFIIKRLYKKIFDP